MAIGDDWQSIYGWRGSSPELFIDFDRHFPGKGKAKRSAVLTLANNYRSIEPIIRDAEALLGDVQHKQAKASQAIKATQPGDHGVRLIQRFDSKARLPELLKQIRAQCAYAAERNSRERNAVLLLSRRNEPLQAITAEIAIALTHASGVPARIEGIHIHTPAGLFIVAEACSGVKFLIAMVTLAVLVCFTRFESWPRRIAFLAACIIVPILANGVRAWATIYVAQYVGAEQATGFDHLVYGWIFFAIVVAALLGGAWRFFEREPEAYGWRAEIIAGWRLVARAEALRFAPGSAALAIIALAAIAALVAVL